MICGSALRAAVSIARGGGGLQPGDSRLAAGRFVPRRTLAMLAVSWRRGSFLQRWHLTGVHAVRTLLPALRSDRTRSVTRHQDSAGSGMGWNTKAGAKPLWASHSLAERSNLVA
jgi:hypothetical protein